MKTCKIIAIEGIDGSGKTLQTEMLKNHLTSIGKTYFEMSFPVYESFFGNEIGKLLSGNYKLNAIKVDSKSMSLWYALDRATTFKNIDYSNYDFLLLNRYSLSNAVYQGLRYTETDKLEFAKWVFELEFEQLHLPKPHLSIILDVDSKMSKINVESKGFRDYIGNDADVYEKSSNIMDNARDLYLQFAKQLDNIEIINCMNKDGMRSPEVISKDILKAFYRSEIL